MLVGAGRRLKWRCDIFETAFASLLSAVAFLVLRHREVGIVGVGPGSLRRVFREAYLVESPFLHHLDDAPVESVSRHLFDHWRQLAEHRMRLSVQGGPAALFEFLTREDVVQKTVECLHVGAHVLALATVGQ